MCGCVGDREALLDSVLSWQHSLWPDTGGRGRSVRAKEKGGRKGGAGYVCKAGCESPQGKEERRRQRSGGRTGSASVIDVPPAWSE